MTGLNQGVMVNKGVMREEDDLVEPSNPHSHSHAHSYSHFHTPTLSHSHTEGWSAREEDDLVEPVVELAGGGVDVLACFWD